MLGSQDFTNLKILPIWFLFLQTWLAFKKGWEPPAAQLLCEFRTNHKSDKSLFHFIVAVTKNGIEEATILSWYKHRTDKTECDPTLSPTQTPNVRKMAFFQRAWPQALQHKAVGLRLIKRSISNLDTSQEQVFEWSNIASYGCGLRLNWRQQPSKTVMLFLDRVKSCTQIICCRLT